MKGKRKGLGLGFGLGFREGEEAWARVSTWVAHGATCHILSNLDEVKRIGLNCENSID